MSEDRKASGPGSLNMVSSEYNPRRMAELANVLKNYSEGALEKMAAEIGKIMEWIGKGARYPLPAGYGDWYVSDGKVPSYFCASSMEEQRLYFCRPRKVLGGYYVIDVGIWETREFMNAPGCEVASIPVTPVALYELISYKAAEAAARAKAMEAATAPSTSNAGGTDVVRQMGVLEASIRMFADEYVKAEDRGKAEMDLWALVGLARTEALKEALSASGYDVSGGRCEGGGR